MGAAQACAHAGAPVFVSLVTPVRATRDLALPAWGKQRPQGGSRYLLRAKPRPDCVNTVDSLR